MTEDDKMGKAVACKKCGGKKWVQFELRKTGLVILGNSPCLSSHCLVKPYLFLKCLGCGDVLNGDESKVVVGEAAQGEVLQRAN
jgi:hypothetical protein